MNKKHTLWVEKYRPTSLEDYIGNEDIIYLITDSIEKNDIPHLLLTGPAGTGKTTLAKLLVHNLDCEYLYINASDERGMDVMRDKIKKFAMTSSFSPLKIIILDEADFLRLDNQAILRNIIETYSLQTRFILTANYKERIIEPLISRLHGFELRAPSKRDIYYRLEKILKEENIPNNKEVLIELINNFYPDIRKIISTLQYSIEDGKLKKLKLQTDFDKDEFLNPLNKPGKNSWIKMRQYLLNKGINDYDFIFRILYDNVEQYGKGNEGLITIAIADYQYKSQQVVDKEINMAALLAKINNILK